MAAILRNCTQNAMGDPSAKPTYTLDGQTVQWESYQQMLMNLDNLERMIQRASARGGFEVRSRAVSG